MLHLSGSCLRFSKACSGFVTKNVQVLNYVAKFEMFQFRSIVVVVVDKTRVVCHLHKYFINCIYFVLLLSKFCIL